MRLLPLTILLLVFATGCPGVSAESAADNSDDDAGQGPPGTCFADNDCVPAAATCCECPTFATSASDPNTRACGQVECPPSVCPDNVEAACDTEANQCTLRCKPLACDATCEFGYAIDPSGCLSCTCASPVTDLDACMFDTDCVRTREDCCGCVRGGEDTAVLATEQPRFDAALMCDAMPFCPDPQTTSCAGEAPRCVQGQCELLSDIPAGACGTTALGPCPAGEVCTVNASDQANLYGLGLCRPL
ncbi:MAG: hypothetical protein ABI867_21030 [Kofleriaceae bacterium]